MNIITYIKKKKVYYLGKWLKILLGLCGCLWWWLGVCGLVVIVTVHGVTGEGREKKKIFKGKFFIKF